MDRVNAETMNMSKLAEETGTRNVEVRRGSRANRTNVEYDAKLSKDL